MTSTEYKFVELSIVTDESLEEAVNEWVSEGWLLDGIHFVAGTSSRRPQMAFVAFTRLRAEDEDAAVEDAAAEDAEDAAVVDDG